MSKSKADNSNPSEKVLLLILSLISVGLLVAIVYVWYNALGKSAPSKPGDFLKTEQTKTPVETATPSAQIPEVLVPLTITSPKDQEVLTTKTLTVSGQTLPMANLTITGGKEDVISQADETGEFSEKITLEEGDNSLTVTAFDEAGHQTSQTVTIIYAP